MSIEPQAFARTAALGIALALICLGQAWAANPARCVNPSIAPQYPEDTGLTGVTPTLEAVRFLNNATFGADLRSVRHLGGMTRAEWFAEQVALPASCHLVSLNQTQDNDSRDNRLEVWWRHALTAPDQLRQRVAFALSEIFVVSDVSSPIPQNALASWYDILVRNAFGNYRDLIEQVTLSPAMGSYLSMLRNRKPNRAEGIRADENYAREIMQLFSIGLVRLERDGTPTKVDGNTVPTYSQKDIEGLARVFTGWTFADAYEFDWWAANDWRSPMRAFQSYHDRGEKTILNNTVIPPGGTAEQDLAAALDTIFHHPNVGPFIGRQLIQRLVTSNPSPAYVARVAARFESNSQGVRGDLKSVVRQVLLDKEALGSIAENPYFGKLREPVLAMSHLWRLFNARSWEGTYYYQRWYDPLAQTPLSAPSVFNFFKPGYSPSGPLAKAGLVAPEFQLVNDPNNVDFLNELFGRVNNARRDNPWADPSDILIGIGALTSRAANPTNLVSWLNTYLAAGRLPADFRTTLVDYLETIPMDSWEGVGTRRALDALYLVASSPYYLVQY